VLGVPPRAPSSTAATAVRDAVIVFIIAAGEKRSVGSDARGAEGDASLFYNHRRVIVRRAR
jgi:hypothetical protein